MMHQARSSHCYFEENFSENGGALSTGDGTIVEHCVFKGNEASFGGGIFGDHQVYTLTDSVFSLRIRHTGVVEYLTLKRRQESKIVCLKKTPTWMISLALM